ncbi:MAG: GatB/YqeY domain-containing protein [Flavobacteriales bacterium]|nr:GatB/YqeY domain-containing protein [Flavobacteriales bacterium]
MNLTEKINNDIKEAMKSGDKDRLMALRDIKSKLLIEMTKEGGDGKVDDSVGLGILNKLLKQRNESADIYRTQGREDLLNDELKQATVIQSYLPEPLSEEKIAEVIRAVVAETGASSIADMGKVMGLATKKLAGQADGKIVSEWVKKILSGS